MIVSDDEDVDTVQIQTTVSSSSLYKRADQRPWYRKFTGGTPVHEFLQPLPQQARVCGTT